MNLTLEIPDHEVRRALGKLLQEKFPEAGITPDDVTFEVKKTWRSNENWGRPASLRVNLNRQVVLA